MTDSNDIFGSEPARDPVLGAALAAVVGRTPVGDADLGALASRIASAARARHAAAWWSYAARWERRALPVALAAGIAGLLTLWSLGTRPAPSAELPPAPDAVVAVVEGTPAAEAARSLTQSLTASDALPSGSD